MFLFPIKVTTDDVVYKINGNLTNSFYYITNSFYYATKIIITNYIKKSQDGKFSCLSTDIKAINREYENQNYII